MVVQELGWDTDCDEELRTQIMDLIDADMVEETDDADLVLLWQRADTEVADGLVDAQRDLSAKGCIWLLTPKRGRNGFVGPSDIQEGIALAGMTSGVSVNISPIWNAIKVVRVGHTRR